MTLEELNKHYIKSQYLDKALALVKEEWRLNISMLQKRFNLGYLYAALLYEMVDLKLQETTDSFALSAEIA